MPRHRPRRHPKRRPRPTTEIADPVIAAYGSCPCPSGGRVYAVLHCRSAAALAAAIRAGKLSPVDFLDAGYVRIDQRAARLNAFIRLTRTSAWERARGAECATEEESIWDFSTVFSPLLILQIVGPRYDGSTRSGMAATFEWPNPKFDDCEQIEPL